MPFIVKDALQYKRNDRQIREIHEKEYAHYLANLRQQQDISHNSNTYYLPLNHIHEIERSRLRHSLEKQNRFDRIHRENYLFLDRLSKVNQRATIDDRNHTYQQNLDTFTSKRCQQRANQYKRIYDDNQLLLQRINTIQGHLVTKEQCENDWKKHVDVMKKTCDYPENIDKFVTKISRAEQKQACFYSRMRSAQWNERHCIGESRTRVTMTPLALLLDKY